MQLIIGIIIILGFSVIGYVAQPDDPGFPPKNSGPVAIDTETLPPGGDNEADGPEYIETILNVHLTGPDEIKEGKMVKYEVIVDNIPESNLFFQLRVKYHTADNSDFIEAEGSRFVTIPVGSKKAGFLLRPKDDGVYEREETFTVEIVAAKGHRGIKINSDRIETIIRDTSPPPAIFVNDITIQEPELGKIDAIFTISLSHASKYGVTANYQTSDETALAGEDYEAAYGQLVMMPGELTKEISVTIFSDMIIEDVEYFHLSLSNAVNAVLSKDVGVGTILDTPQVKPVELHLNGPAMVEEGESATYTIVMVHAQEEDVTITLSLVNINSEDSDFVQPPGEYTATILAGETSATFEVETYDDHVYEQEETFSVSITHVIGPPSIEVMIDRVQTSIADTTQRPEITINDVFIEEPSGMSIDAVFTVTLSNPSDEEIAVYYRTSDGTARKGKDYEFEKGNVVFLPGEVSKVISVPIYSDHNIDEDDLEYFYINLDKPTNAILMDSQGKGSIINDAPFATSEDDWDGVTGATEQVT